MSCLAKHYTNLRSDRGVSMLEFALVAVLFVGLIITFMDLARIYTTQALLTRAAQQGVNLATKIDGLDNDIAWTDAAAPEFTDLYSDYRNARTAVERSATLLPLTVAQPWDFSGNNNAWITLLPFTPLDEIAGAPQPQNPRFAMILRPGDSALDSDGNTVHHLQRCSTAAGCPVGKSRLTTDTMESMLQQYPIIVQVQARVQTISPYLNNMILRGNAMGYREEPVQSGLPGEFSPNDIDDDEVFPPDEIPPDEGCVLTEDDCPPDYNWDPVWCSCYRHTCEVDPDSCPPGTYFDVNVCGCLSTGGS